MNKKLVGTLAAIVAGVALSVTPAFAANLYVPLTWFPIKTGLSVTTTPGTSVDTLADGQFNFTDLLYSGVAADKDNVGIPTMLRFSGDTITRQLVCVGTAGVPGNSRVVESLSEPISYYVQTTNSDPSLFYMFFDGCHAVLTPGETYELEYAFHSERCPLPTGWNMGTFNGKTSVETIKVETLAANPEWSKGQVMRLRFRVVGQPIEARDVWLSAYGTTYADGHYTFRGVTLSQLDDNDQPIIDAIHGEGQTNRDWADAAGDGSGASAGSDKANQTQNDLDMAGSLEDDFNASADAALKDVNFGGFTFIAPVLDSMSASVLGIRKIFTALGPWQIVFTFPLLLGLALVLIGRLSRESVHTLRVSSGKSNTDQKVLPPGKG